MKTRFLTVIAVGLIAMTICLAGENTQRSTLSAELLGRAGTYSLNYDYLITDELAAGGGLSYLSGKNLFDEYVNALVIPVYGNYYFYKKAQHRLFGTLGADFVAAAASSHNVTYASGPDVVPLVGLGYEYRNSDGFLFRAAPYFAVLSDFKPWFGMSAGYSF